MTIFELVGPVEVSRLIGVSGQLFGRFSRRFVPKCTERAWRTFEDATLDALELIDGSGNPELPYRSVIVDEAQTWAHKRYVSYEK